MTVGIGSGSTAALFIQQLALRVKGGLKIRGICSSTPKRRDYVTEKGNWILDCFAPPIADAALLQQQIRGIIGVVEHGLFLGMVDVALVSDGDTVWEVR